MPEATKSETAATFTFEVTIEGLVALVPSKTLGAGDTGEFLLALPDLLRGGPQDSRLPRIIPPHLACVVVPADNVGNSANTGADLEFGVPGGPRFLIFAFRSEKLVFEHGGSLGLSATRSVLRSGQVSPKDRGAPNDTDLAWVPTLRATKVTGADVFDARLLADNLAPGSGANLNRLIGTFVPTSGTLSTDGVIRHEDDNEPVVFDFQDQRGKSRFKQAIFNHFKLKGNAPLPSLEMVFSDQFERKRSVRLIPDSGGELKLRVVNAELEEIVNLGKGFPATSDMDLDFAIGYWLSQAWGSVKKEDIVIPHAKGHGPGGSGPPCRMPGYEGASK